MALKQSDHAEAPVSRKRRILFIDAYDSFSYNIVSLLKETLGHDNVDVYILHIDLTLPKGCAEPNWQESDFLDRLRTFDAVVCGPGPGNPSCAQDVGVTKLLWQLQTRDLLPVLGICLGFQSLVESLGGKVRRLRQGLHGMVRSVDHGKKDIFERVEPFKTTLYHSLCMNVGQDDVPAKDWEQERWALGGMGTSDLMPLAWLEENGERILMAARHRRKPFWGLQYHPESVCTENAAHDVIRNWFEAAMQWNARSNREKVWRTTKGWLPVQTLPQTSNKSYRSKLDEVPDVLSLVEGPHDDSCYAFRSLDLPQGLDTADVVTILGLQNEESIILDSSSHVNSDPLAASSIIAVGVSDAPRFSHKVGSSHIRFRDPRPDADSGNGTVYNIPCDNSSKDMWDTLTDFWRRTSASLKDQTFAPCSFRGGFLGFVTYELGLHNLTPEALPSDRASHPDLVFAWITNTIVLDHKAGKLYVQCIGKQSLPDTWLDDTCNRLLQSHLWNTSSCPERSFNSRQKHQIQGGRTNEDLYAEVARGIDKLGFKIPESQAYEAAVEECRDFISAGDSYELCLTGETLMTRPETAWYSPSSNTEPQAATCGCHAATKDASKAHANGHKQHQDQRQSSWQIYQTLRSRQPAPFGSFIRLEGLNFLGSSPERFLKIDTEGQCSMRPMKGTVRKSATVSTLKEAEVILHTPKEIAENLMIVDLVRHDLHGICGPGKVFVPELLKVEEYATIFTMVTNVSAQLSKKHIALGLQPDTKPFHGLHVLGSVLPPGSMTGAPKKKSCEILSRLEKRERSVYSGVVGYFDVTGQADWSVNIRSMWRWSDEADETPEGERREIWHVGAGGAVTILSTAEGEKEEMLTKLCGPLGVFRDAA